LCLGTLDLNKERKDLQDNKASHDFDDDGTGDRFYRGGEDDDVSVIGEGLTASTLTHSIQFAVKRAQEQQQMTLQQHEIALNEQIIRERNAAIREVETDIVEVNEIFQDLAVMVHEQGLQIDNI